MSRSLQDTGYRHWNGTVRPVWSRRAVVARQTMTACLRGRLVRFLVVASWVFSLITVVASFLIGQILVPEGLLEPLVNLMDNRAQQLVQGVSAWLALYPDITVRATTNLLLLYLSSLLQTISFLIVTLVIPRLLTRDLASNAVVVYASRAISRFDYLLGKLVGLLGVLSLCWLGPVLVAWFLGNVVAPDWSFFWHSRLPLLHAITAIVPTMIATALVALGISALSSKARVTVGFWLGFWLLTPALIPLAKVTRPWLATLCFRYDIDQFSFAVFRPYRDFVLARDSLPFFNRIFGGLDPDKVQAWGEASLLAPSIGLLAASALSVAFLLRKTRTR